MQRTHALNVAQDVESLFHPYTPLDKVRETGPLVMTRGDGIYVEDDQGRRYLEAVSGLWCTSLGFSEQRLMDAAQQQFRPAALLPAVRGRANEPSIALSHALIEKTRHLGMAMAMFANSGSEANDQAVKMVWYYFNAIGKPHKKKLIARERAYHGVTVMAASLTGLAGNHADFDLPIGDRGAAHRLAQLLPLRPPG
jgi:4-aminobutyrate--pyruvate transaminase